MNSHSQPRPRACNKVFVIGHNKTGTTSLGQALSNLGFCVGEQTIAERMFEDWRLRRFSRIVQYCQSADAFQDIPFSLDYTYQVLDHEFPGSKFILTVREDSDVWFESLTRFHTLIVGRGVLPSANDLMQFPYCTVGWLWRVQQAVYGIDKDSLYDRKRYIEYYDSHNASIREYFRYRSEDFLELNVATSTAMATLCGFLNVEHTGQTMPHANRSTL